MSRFQQGGSSSSTNVPQIAPVSPVLLPIDTDSDLDESFDDLSTILAEDEQREKDFYSSQGVADAFAYWCKVKDEDPMFFRGSGNSEDAELCRIFLASQGDEIEH